MNLDFELEHFFIVTSFHPSSNHNNSAKPIVRLIISIMLTSAPIRAWKCNSQAFLMRAHRQV